MTHTLTNATDEDVLALAEQIKKRHAAERAEESAAINKRSSWRGTRARLDAARAATCNTHDEQNARCVLGVGHDGPHMTLNGRQFQTPCK